jgi:hypothetical protein
MQTHNPGNAERRCTLSVLTSADEDDFGECSWTLQLIALDWAHAAPHVSTACLPLYHCPPGHAPSRHATSHHPLSCSVRRFVHDVKPRSAVSVHDQRGSAIELLISISHISHKVYKSQLPLAPYLRIYQAVRRKILHRALRKDLDWMLFRQITSCEIGRYSLSVICSLWTERSCSLYFVQLRSEIQHRQGKCTGGRQWVASKERWRRFRGAIGSSQARGSDVRV